MDEFIYSLLSYRDYMRFVKPSSSPKEYGIFLFNRRKNRNSKKKQESRCFMDAKNKML